MLEESNLKCYDSFFLSYQFADLMRQGRYLLVLVIQSLPELVSRYCLRFFGNYFGFGFKERFSNVIA